MSMEKLIKRAGLVIVATSVLAGCTAPDDAARVLATAGYTRIKVGGYGWFKCDKNDSFATKFSAYGPSGREVTGVVCSDWLKASTIRID